MNCEFHYVPFEYISIQDTYLKDQLKNVWTELDLVFPHLKTVEYTLSAKDSEGQFKKKSKGIFLDYSEFNTQSSILNYRDSLLNLNLNEEIKTVLFNYYPCLNPNKGIQYDCNSLVAYYETGDYYKKHRDSSLFTIITFLCQDNSKFTGGELVFPEHNLKVSPINNTSIIFPSIIEHEVLPVKLLDESQRFGRYSITTFVDMTMYQSKYFSNLKVGDNISDFINMIDLNLIPQSDFTK